MQEDTKPENDDIQDEERKKPFSRSEYHGVITSYAGLALSLIAIILSVITMYQSHIMETREIVQILRAEDDGYYHFDGEKLFKNYQVTVANNSAIPVSVVEITIERDGEARTFEISDLPDILPLNMESNHTEMITIPWEIPHNPSAHLNRLYRRNVLQSSSKELNNQFAKPDIVVPSRRGESLKDSEELLNDLTEKLSKPDELSPEELYSALTQRGRLRHSKYYAQKTLPLSVTLHTSKNNQYVFITEDMGAPESTSSESPWAGGESASSEGSWVAGLFVKEFDPEPIWNTSKDSTEQNQEE